MCQLLVHIWTDDCIEVEIFNFLSEMEAKAFMLGFHTARNYPEFTSFKFTLDGKDEF